MAPRIPIFNMFGPSPLQPLQKHIDQAYLCTKKLLPFFEAILNNDWHNAKLIYADICKLERLADQLKHGLRQHLHKDLFLPVPRSDLLVMLMLQDRIANKAKDVAGLALERQIQLPELIREAFMMLLERSIAACLQVKKAINELDELLEAGFRGKEVKLVESMLVDLDNLEFETDEQQHQLRQLVLTIESELPPVECMFLYQIIQWVGALADRAQSVGGQLQILLAH